MNQRQRAFRVGAAGILAGAAFLACGCRRDVPTAPPVTTKAAAPATGPASAMPAHPGAGATMVNSLGMKLLHVPPGEFRMGSGPAEPGRHDDETAHDVKITRGFWIAAEPTDPSECEMVASFNVGAPTNLRLASISDVKCAGL